jgi:hypothetical protein
MKPTLFVQTVLRKKKSRDGTVHIIYYRLKILWNGITYVIEVSSLHSIESKNWCSTLQRLKTKDDKSARINRQVEKQINYIKDTFDEYRLVSTDFSPDAFKQQVYRAVNPAKFKDVPTNTGALSIYDDYLSVYRSNFGQKRVLRYKLVQRLQSEYFERMYRRKDMPVSVFSYVFYFGFRNFLLADGNRRINTVDGYLKVLRAAVNYAVLSGNMGMYQRLKYQSQLNSEDSVLDVQRNGSVFMRRSCGKPIHPRPVQYGWGAKRSGIVDKR